MHLRVIQSYFNHILFRLLQNIQLQVQSCTIVIYINGILVLLLFILFFATEL